MTRRRSGGPHFRRKWVDGEWRTVEKVRYDNELDALAAVQALRKDVDYLRRVENGENLGAYQCRDCGGWHLGRHRRPRELGEDALNLLFAVADQHVTWARRGKKQVRFLLHDDAGVRRVDANPLTGRHLVRLNVRDVDWREGVQCGPVELTDAGRTIVEEYRAEQAAAWA